MAMTAIAVTPTWELLQATNVTDAQLAAVQKSWAEMNFLRDSENALTFERAWMTDSIRKSRASHEGFEATLGSMTSMGGSSISGGGWTWPPDWEAMTERPRYMAAEVMWRSSWSYSAEKLKLQSLQIMLESVRAMRTNQSQFYKADYDAMMVRVSKLGLTNTGTAFFRALKIPDFSELFGDLGLSSALRKTIRMEAAGRVAVAAIALKRFELKHGKWPETLGELVQEFISTVPIDPYDGKPLRYHANSDGTFLLYAVGDDGVDDGGDPTTAAISSASLFWQNDKARDWVWPQQATEAEIKYFYEHPPK
jgi:hypothetical protein